MKNYRKTVFMNRRLGELPGVVTGRTWDGYSRCRIKGLVDKEHFTTRNGYTFGQVLCNEMNIAMNKVFRIDEEFSPEFVIWPDGIYERANGKWVNITNIFDKTVAFKRLLDNSVPIIECYSETCENRKFSIGTLIKGINDIYGITDRNMYIGEIINIEDDGNTISIRIHSHEYSRYEGSVQEAQWVNDGEYMFTIIK